MDSKRLPNSVEQIHCIQVHMNIFSKLYTGGRLKVGYTSGRVKADLELGKPGLGGTGERARGYKTGVIGGQAKV